ncbi:MAG: adenosylcobinamide-phosphate synthase CbiB [Hyphomicrobiaceae bacterium]|nr:adenosylcobinamide-phosphate synthase CbiB [Hyphomicrobiaceae bacterium]
MIMTALAAIIAVCLDGLLGEPRRWHPLVGFGALADGIEKRLNQHMGSPLQQRLYGLLALAALLLPITALAVLPLFLPPALSLTFTVLGLYLAIGHESLFDHAAPIADALAQDDQAMARVLAGRIVSRDPETLDIAKATCESVLENGNDSTFAALFWFFVAGLPGVILYRLANTLDAMWGYRNKRFENFGWAAARFDDALNFIPARLTALSYALLAPLVGGKLETALLCWYNQGYLCESPNAGPVMASGAGALGVSLGGRARYHGKWHERPTLGAGPAPEARDISRALKLVTLTLTLWLAVFLGIAFFKEG